MKKLRLLICSLLFIPLLSIAQVTDLKQMNEQTRYAYLEKKAREIIKNFGPDYNRDSIALIISNDTHTFFYDINERSASSEIEPLLIKNNGRQYYEVICPCDTLKEKLSWGFAAKIKIWEDDGQPLEVIFGNGIGKNFFSRPYNDWIKEGVKDYEIVRYQKVVIPPYYMDQFKDF